MSSSKRKRSDDFYDDSDSEPGYHTAPAKRVPVSKQPFKPVTVSRQATPNASVRAPLRNGAPTDALASSKNTGVTGRADKGKERGSAIDVDGIDQDDGGDDGDDEEDKEFVAKKSVIPTQRKGDVGSSKNGRTGDRPRPRTLHSEMQSDRFQLFIDTQQEENKAVNAKVEKLESSLNTIAQQQEATQSLLLQMNKQFLRFTEQTTSRDSTPAPVAASDAESLQSQPTAAGPGAKGPKKDPNYPTIRRWVQTVFYTMIGYASGETPPPPYFFSNGSPNYFPEELKDDGAGTTLLRPNWSASFASQSEWFDSYMDRFYNTIQDKSPCASVLRSTPRDQALEILKTCAFRTVSKAWKDARMTDEQIQFAKAVARRKQRRVNKLNHRISMRAVIPEILPAIYNFLFTLGYTSDEETDTEFEGARRLIVKRPESRATWINNLWTAIYTALGVNLYGDPQANRGTRRVIGTVEGTIPQLSGDGAQGSIMRLPLVAFSKAWWKSNVSAEARERYGYLVDHNSTVAPNLQDFLAQYPLDRRLIPAYIFGERNLDHPSWQPESDTTGFEIDPSLEGGHNTQDPPSASLVNGQRTASAAENDSSVAPGLLEAIQTNVQTQIEAPPPKVIPPGSVRSFSTHHKGSDTAHTAGSPTDKSSSTVLKPQPVATPTRRELAPGSPVRESSEKSVAENTLERDGANGGGDSHVDAVKQREECEDKTEANKNTEVAESDRGCSTTHTKRGNAKKQAGGTGGGPNEAQEEASTTRKTGGKAPAKGRVAGGAARGKASTKGEPAGNAAADTPIAERPPPRRSGRNAR